VTTAVRREALPCGARSWTCSAARSWAAEFAPGERLTERVLCERFAVSRTVVREALRQLESEGLVNHRAPARAGGRRAHAADAASLYEVRAVLEALAGRAFAERATPPQRDALRAALAAVEALLDGGGRSPTCSRPRTASTTRCSTARTTRWPGPPCAACTPAPACLRGLTLRAAGRPAQTRRELRAIADAAGSGDGSAAWHACEDHVRSAAAVAAELMRNGRTTVTEDAQQYVDDMARTRGYVLDYHKKMAKQDFPCCRRPTAW
jgi:DNA-binding GntR family transcriptional regulator